MFVDVNSVITAVIKLMHHSVFVRVARLVVQMSERREGLCTEAIKLVAQHIHLLGLLLEDIKKLALVRDLLDLLLRIALVIRLRVRLEVDDLLSLLHSGLQDASLCLELLRLSSLLVDLTLLLAASLHDGANAVVSVHDDALHLVFETFLVIFVLLLMLTLKNLLRLLRDTVHLHVEGALLKIINLKLETLLSKLNTAHLGAEVGDFSEQTDLIVSLHAHMRVLVIDDLALHEDSVLVVSGDRKLRHFNLTLLHVHHALEVEADLVDAVGGLLLTDDLLTMSFLQCTVLFLKEVNVLLQRLDLLLEHLLVSVHLDTSSTLLLEALPVFLADT